MSDSDYPFILGDDIFAGLCDDFLAGQPQVRAANSTQKYRLAVWAFRRWMLAQGRTHLDEDAVKAWLLHRTASMTVSTVRIQTSIISLFADFLLGRGLLSDNPFQELKRKHRQRGMLGIVRHIAEIRSTVALDAEADVQFSGPLGSYFRRYLDQRRALGAAARTHELHLSSFERFLRQRRVGDLASIDQVLIEEWSHWQGETTVHNHHRRLLILDKFFDFLVGYQLLDRSPMPEVPRYRRQSFPPYIYTREEVRRILEAAAALTDHRLLTHRGPTYRMYLLTLYTLGLRRKEALDLRVGDVDVGQGSLTVREGKFRKGRVLPLGPRFGVALQRYIETHPLLSAAPTSAFLFPKQSGRNPRLSYESVGNMLTKLLHELGIAAPQGIRPPGLHSFRHSFAVHRIERWHREGADLSVRLPLLAAFLGHQDIAHTQVYLTMTPERFRLVGQSFERMFGSAVKPERSESHEA